MAIQLAAVTAVNSELSTQLVYLSSPLTEEFRAKDRAVARDRIALAASRLLNRWHLAPNPTE
jgi:hypothetical protein